MKKGIYKNYLLGLIIFSIVLSPAFFLTTKHAEAVWGVTDVVFDPVNWVENMWNAFTSGEIWVKEYILDPLAWVVAKKLIQSITDSLVDWINSGFEGNPTFVDPDTFLTDVADQASGAFIKQVGLEGVLCSPFRLPILASLNLSYKKSTLPRFQCTLSVAKENWQRNWDEFMYDFTNGGWDRWLNVTTQQQNNPYGAYLMAYDELQVRRLAAQERGKTEVNWGSGFVSLQECSGDISGDIGQEKMCDTQCGQLKDSDDCFNSCMEIEGWDENLSSAEKCKLAGEQMQNTTPGKIIEGRLSKALGMDLESLGIADEISEIIAALINQVFSSDKGLRGYSKDSGDSFYEEIEFVPAVNTKQGLMTMIQKNIDNEEIYKDNLNESIKEYNLAIGKVKDLKKCYEALGGMQDVIDNELKNLLEELNGGKLLLEQELIRVENLIRQLNGLKKRINMLSDDEFADSATDLLKEYTDLKSQTHSGSEIVDTGFDYKTIKDYLDDILNGPGGINSLYQQCLQDLSAL